MGVNGPTRPAILEELPGINVIDRSSMNAWEDAAFRASVERTGRKRLIIGALWTEICLVYPAISAMKDGYEVMFVVDAVGGTSQVAHKTGLDRLVQAGAIPNTTRATIDEWFRDWKSPQAVKYRDISKWYRDAVRADVVP
jgi:nicotinamidase-related amidase